MADYHCMNFAAGGTIFPCRFVTGDYGVEHTVLQASAATNVILGVSIESQYQPPQSSTTDFSAAEVNADGLPQNIGVWQAGSVCSLQIGSGGCSAFDKLTSDANGCGIPTVVSGNMVGAIALQNGNINEWIAVSVCSPGVSVH